MNNIQEYFFSAKVATGDGSESYIAWCTIAEAEGEGCEEVLSRCCNNVI